jgi:hypothetical protein
MNNIQPNACKSDEKMNNIQPNASCKSDEKINTLSIAEKYKRYIGNKENDSTSIHLEYLETAETIARYLCFYIADTRKRTFELIICSRSQEDI